ncbi:ComEC/Rec2 family competence protein [Ruegeria meonggei]|uniref:ComEC/Rec2 family competence protein n=1 Tax=Ruegeria meonggei TaxID=1446476 RepID=UPI00366AB8DD
MFRMVLHPARDGDCVQLSWGSRGNERHLFVDLGRGSTWGDVQPVLKELGDIELLVMSHIDADHIAGAIPMVRADIPAFNPARVWYNARPQLEKAHRRLHPYEAFGARQAEKLSRGIAKFGWPQNEDFASGVVSTNSPEAQVPIELPGGLKLTLLSPGDAELAELLPQWDRELGEAGLRTFDPDEDDPLDSAFEALGSAPNVRVLAAAPYEPDTTKANGASISFIAEYKGVRVLLAADAHSEVLERRLARLAEQEDGRYRLDLLKICHHGSKANTSPTFLSMIDCTRFAFSTNGARHHHPDPETIARILVTDRAREKTLYFNYRQSSSEQWESATLSSRWNYRTVIPEAAVNGRIEIDLR